MCTFIGDRISLLDKVIGLLSVCTIFDLDLDTVRDLGVKQLACKLDFRFYGFMFI